MDIDKRNVQDKYRWWDTLDIKDDLKETCSGLQLVLLNFDHDFNIGSSIRNGNWFNVGGIWIVGRRQFDTRGCVGAHHYMDIRRVETMIDVIRELGSDYTYVAAEIGSDCNPDYVHSLYDYKFDEKTVVVVGQESMGVPREILAMCDAIVYIPGRGSCRSLNAANTSGIFAYEYTKQMME